MTLAIRAGARAAAAAALLGWGLAQAPAFADSVESVHVFDGAHRGGVDPVGALLQASDGNLWGTTNAGGEDDDGIVFRMSLDGTYQRVTGVPLSDGRNFVGDLVQTPDGTLYAVTNLGGDDNGGSILAITLDGAARLVYSFNPAGWGGHPTSGLTPASDGNLYGVLTDVVYRFEPATQTWAVVATLPENALCQGVGSRLVAGSDGALYGMGVENGGCVFRVTPRGAAKVIHSFKRNNIPAGLIAGSDGNLYGTLREGYHTGHANCGTIFRLSTSGRQTVLHDFPCGRDGKQSYPVGGLVQGADGTLHGSALHWLPGGATSYYTVWSMAADGSGFAEARIRPATGTPFNMPIQASDGNYYATAPGGKYDEGRIVRITP
jgi:uncharacterized repeat protein (TIGR03803 family)